MADDAVKKLISDILPQSEYESERSFAELEKYVFDKKKELSERVGEFYKTYDHGTKKFYDELCPLYAFLKNYCKEDIEKCQALSGNQSYDSVIYLKNKNDPIYCEFTRAIDGHEESLRREALANGNVLVSGLNGQTIVTGTKNNPNRQIISSSEIVNLDLIFLCNMRLLEETIRNKNENKNYQNINPLWIVVCFRYFHSDDEQNITDFYAKKIEPLNKDGKSFFLLGYRLTDGHEKLWSGKNVFPSPVLRRRDNLWRDDFPALSCTMNGKPLAFLDSAASAQKPQCVIDAMTRVMSSGYANIHRGLYEISQNLTEEFENTRKKIAAFIGAPSEQNIIFTRNATEGINIVAQSWGRTFLKAGDEIIISAMEHHANIVPWQLLADQIGIVIKVIPIRTDGTLDLAAFEKLLSTRTKLIGVVEISNALGTINPVNKIIEIARKFNPEIKILVDGSQGVVHRVVNVTAMDADFYVFTGHKLYAPTGIGVLYGKYDLLQSMPPYQGGGDMIDRVSFNGTTYREAPFKFEAGTPAILEVIGLGAAVDYLVGIGMDNIAAHEASLLQYATQELQQIKGLKIHGTQNLSQKAGILSFTLPYAHPSDIGMILDQCGVAVRTGHHCAMPLMEFLGIDATVRASLALYSVQSDIDALVKALYKVESMFGE